MALWAAKWFYFFSNCQIQLSVVGVNDNEILQNGFLKEWNRFKGELADCIGKTDKDGRIRKFVGKWFLCRFAILSQLKSMKTSFCN